VQPGDCRSSGGAAADIEGLVSDGSVQAAVLSELEAMPENLRQSALAATALAMARELDDPENSATSKSMCAGKLIDATEKLRALVPDETEQTRLDEIAQRREQRLARQSAS
jgi:hypothetical protein